MAYNYYNNPYIHPYSLSGYQQAQNNQVSTTGFIRVPSEDYARNFPVSSGQSATFIDENKPYCYVKTMDASPLGTFKFERYRLVKEDDLVSGDTANVTEEVEKEKQDYALKSDLAAVWKELEGLKENLNTLKPKKERNDE